MRDRHIIETCYYRVLLYAEHFMLLEAMYNGQTGYQNSAVQLHNKFMQLTAVIFMEGIRKRKTV